MNKKIFKIIALFVASYFSLLLIFNFGSLLEGLRFVFLKPSYSLDKVSKDSDYKTLYDMELMDDEDRAIYIKDYLSSKNINFLTDYNNLGGQSIFVANKNKNFKHLFVAHYDTYLNKKGAVDNTGSVSVLLSSIKELENEIHSGNVAFLFTANEEDGLVGSKSFLSNFVKNKNYSFEKVINLDCIGAGDTIAVSSGTTQGLVFNIFPFGKMIFNGQALDRAINYIEVDKDFIDFKRLGVKIKNNIVAYSDTIEFIKAGFNSVHLTSDNMDAIVNYSHKNNDDIELLADKYLDDTKNIILEIAKE
jgi:Zn-dependent M28 family amino/carboxypeptidase